MQGPFKYQESTLGYLLWPGQFVDKALGERVFQTAQAGVPSFEACMTEVPFTSEEVFVKRFPSACTVLKAMHLQYNEPAKSIKQLDTYIYLIVEPQLRNIASTYLHGLVIYALPSDMADKVTQRSFWSTLSDHLESYSDPRQLRRDYIEGNPSFLLLYMGYTQGCDHCVTSVLLKMEGLNSSFGFKSSAKVSCKACYETVLLDNQIIDPVDWSKVDTIECMYCHLSYSIHSYKADKEEVLCTGCGKLLFRHGCSKCMVFTAEYGWEHCQKCNTCHRYGTPCATSDDLCVLCQLPLSDARYSVTQLKCHKAHMIHSTCLLYNIVSGNSRCPYHCGSVFTAVKGAA
ncbi:Hypothetical protein GLP15_2118 [Giardia lamblia P15]|uniref:Uncharacterized protein n=1 Tax=Giardia intestinalis (strain P15) TaxID=658858 RepID=E1EY89_GIAIA|nr:Hypothetical protein GLP15_2118 [Giardia lamblia P15]